MSVQTVSSALPETLDQLRSCPSCLHLEPNSLPKLSTPVTVLNPQPDASPRRFRMVAKLYESSSGHYILLTQDKLYSPNPVYFNLKHTSVQRVKNNVVRLVADNCDGVCVTLELPSEALVERWMGIIAPVQNCMMGSKSPVIPRSPLLPTLTEDEEE